MYVSKLYNYLVKGSQLGDSRCESNVPNWKCVVGYLVIRVLCYTVINAEQVKCTLYTNYIYYAKSYSAIEQQC